MNRGKLRVFLASTVAGSGLMLASPAWAQAGSLGQEPGAPVNSQNNADPAASESGQDAEASGEIIVTARSRSETAQSAPLAITAVSGATLDDHAITNVGQAAQLTPGLIAAPGAFVDVLYIRGVGTPGTTLGAEQSVGLFIDGVSYGFGRWMLQGYIDLDRVEVLRGPQAMYFGKNTVAGAISLHSARPTRDFEGYVRAGYEFVADERYVQGVVSGPLSKTLAARLVVRASEMEGWVKNIVPNEPKRGPEGDEIFTRATLQWEPTDTLKVTLIGAYDKMKNNFTQPFLAKCGGPNNTAGTSTFGPDPQPCGLKFKAPFWEISKIGQRNGANYESWALTGEAVWDTEHGTLTSITGLNQVKNWTAFPSNGTVNNGVWARVDFETKTFSQEIRFASDFEGMFNFLAGAFYQDSDFFTQNQAYALPDALQGTVNGKSVYTWRRPSTQDQESFSIFGELNLELADTLTLDAGIRYTEDRKDSTLRNDKAAPNVQFITVPVYSAKQKFTDWSPSATLTWKPTQGQVVFASYRTGFKSGGFSHGNAVLFLPQFGQVAPPLSSFLFNEELAEVSEAGYKGQFLDRRLRVELVGYYYTYDDLQVTAFNPTNSSFSTQNAAKARTKGIEFSSAFRATPDLTFSGSLNYSQAKYLDFTAQCNQGVQRQRIAPCDVPLNAAGTLFGQDLSGARLPFGPKWSGRADVDYDTELGNYRLAMGAGVQFSSRFPVNADGRSDNDQKSYARIDARVMFGPSDRKWELALIGNNLTNKAIKIGGGERSRTPLDLTSTYDRARQVEVRGTFRF